MDNTFQDDILDALVEKFTSNNVSGNVIEWEWVNPYAIDGAARRMRFAVGFVDQGQKFGFKASTGDHQWRVAVEWFCQSNPDEDIQKLNNLCRAEVYRTIMSDVSLGGLTVDCSPVMDDVMVEREESTAEGVMVFDIRYRPTVRDLAARH